MTPLLPYGVFSSGGDAPRVGARLGDRVIDLSRLARLSGYRAQLEQPSLNALMSLGPPHWSLIRASLLGHVADAVIVASYLKQDGVWWNEVDPARVATFMQAVAKAR